MTIYAPTTEQVVAIERDRLFDEDPTLRGEKTSLDGNRQVGLDDFLNVFFPNGSLDSTYRQIVQTAHERGIPVRAVTHRYSDESMKGETVGKVECLGAEATWGYHPEMFQGEFYVIVTNILTSIKPDGKSYLVSFPAMDGSRLDRRDLVEEVDGFTLPEVVPKRRKLPQYLRMSSTEVVEKLGMESGFCYPCPSRELVQSSGLDIQLVMDAGLVMNHRARPELWADVPIDLSRNMGPNQGVSLQINYAHLYDIMQEAFGGDIKGCMITPPPRER